MDKIDELQRAIEEQNRLNEERLLLERQRITAQLKQQELEEKSLENRKRQAEAAEATRRAIEEVARIVGELQDIIPVISRMENSNAIILRILDMIARPIISLMIQSEDSEEKKYDLEEILSLLEALSPSMVVYGHVESARDTNIKSDGGDE